MLTGYSIVLEKDKEEKEMDPACVKIGINWEWRDSGLLLVGEDLIQPQMYRRLES